MRGWRAWAWGLLAGVTLLLVLVLSLGPLADLRWHLEHRGALAVGGTHLLVPFGWRSVETGSGEDAELLLRRGRWGWLGGRSIDEISLRGAKGGFDPVELAQRWDRTETRLMIPGDRLEPAPASPFLRAHYRCSDAKRTDEGTISFGCFEREGRWAVWYRGRRDGIHDLVALLESASGAGAATR